MLVVAILLKTSKSSEINIEHNSYNIINNYLININCAAAYQRVQLNYVGQSAETLEIMR